MRNHTQGAASKPEVESFVAVIRDRGLAESEVKDLDYNEVERDRRARFLRNR